jgi:hypothetical protein
MVDRASRSSRVQEEHPSFHDYARGAMASEYNGDSKTKDNKELQIRFPPRPLDGLGPGLYWSRLKNSPHDGKPPTKHGLESQNGKAASFNLKKDVAH